MKKKFRKLAALILSICIMVTWMPTVAWGDTQTIDGLTVGGTGFTYDEPILSVNNGANVALSGSISNSSLQIVVAENAVATITCNNVSISSGKDICPITVNAGASLTLKLKGTNTLTGGSGFYDPNHTNAGKDAISMSSTSTLIIMDGGEHNGVLNLQGGSGANGNNIENALFDYNYGKNGGCGIRGGNIEIKNCTVQAQGGAGGDGGSVIDGGKQCNGGTGGTGGDGIYGSVKIDGSTVTANGGAGGTGGDAGNGNYLINKGGAGGKGGTGISGSSLSIINDGMVKAAGGSGGNDGRYHAYGYWHNSDSSGAAGTGIQATDDVNDWNGLVFASNIGASGGNQSLSEDYTVESGSSFYINNGALTLDSNATLTLKGKLVINDTLDISNGALVIDGGTVIGSGKIIPETAKLNASIEIVSGGKTYKENEPIALSNINYKYGGNGTVTAAWYKYNIEEESIGELLDEAPVNAGTYGVVLSASATDIYNSADSLPAKVTIEKADVSTPTVSLNYETEIFNTTEEMEYSWTTSDESWQDCIENMTIGSTGWDGTSRSIYFRTKEKDNYKASSSKSIYLYSRPTIEDVTVLSVGANTVTLKKLTGCIYSITPGAGWGDSAVFSALTPDTEYTLYQKIPATSNKLASETKTAVVTTKTAAEDVFYTADGDIEITRADGGIIVTQGAVSTTVNGTKITIDGDSTAVANTVSVGEGVEAEITLKNVNIDVSSQEKTAFALNDDAEIKIISEGTNILKSGSNCAGILVPESAKLTLEGDGTLNAYGGKASAGIGGNDTVNAGTIVINSGIVNATGGDDGAGIGGGHANDGENQQYGKFKSIIINGGFVTANGNTQGAGIGAGCWAKALGEIQIHGGTVIAASNSSKYNTGAIGYGHTDGDSRNNGTGKIEITGGTVVTRVSNSGEGSKGLDCSNIIITGGSVEGTRTSTPVNDVQPEADTLYEVEFAAEGNQVEALSLTDADGNLNSYGKPDTVQNGKLVLYLPEGEYTGSVTIDGTEYYLIASAGPGSSSGKLHIMSAWTSEDAENHVRTCTLGGCSYKETKAHTFQWVVDKEATISEKGSKHEECTVCGYQKAAVEIPQIVVYIPETLSESKTIGQKEIEKILSELPEEHYDAEGLAELKKIAADGKKEIAGAKTKTEVEKIVKEVEKKLAAVKTIEEKEAEKAEIIEMLKEQRLVARSGIVTLKNGKKAVKLSWENQGGDLMDFDGVEIFRSTKRDAGYGKEPFFETMKNVYYNTAIKSGVRYYYRIRGYKLIDGEKFYTDWSMKAWRMVR